MNWNLAFDDEFNTTTLDTTKWSLYLPWSNNVSGDNRYHDTNGSYLSYMMPDDVSLPGDGTLHLTTQQRNVTAPSGHVFNYTEGMITSAASLTANYGYYEIRAKLPTGGGNWDAWWMTNGWPPEDDIMEYWPAQPRSHQGLYGMDHAWHDYNNTTSGTVPSTNWHTFGMEWGPGYQKFNIDGVQTLSISGSFVPSNANSQYMLLNSGIQNGQTGGYLAGNTAANTLQVDYVRVYFQSGTGPALTNGSFESGNAGWPPSNDQVVAANARTGDHALQVFGATGTSEQPVSGLLANTTYTYSGYAYVENAAAQALIGVKSYGGAEKAFAVSTTTYSQGAVTFTTGAANTSATVYTYKPTASGNVYFDDMMLELSPTVASISNKSANPGQAIGVPVAVTPGSSGSTWSFSATSSNQTLVKNTDFSYAGSGNSRTLQISPEANQSGTSTITVNITDLFGALVSTTFVLTVNPAVVISGDANSVPTNDVFRVVRNGAKLDVYNDNNTSTPTAEYTYSSVSSVIVSGMASDDTLVVDYTGGDPIPAGGLSFDGGAGNDTLSIIGLGSGNTATIQNGSVQIGSDVFSYTNTEAISLDLGTGSNSLLSKTPVTVPVLTLKADHNSALTLAAASTLPTNTIVTVTAGSTFNMGGQNISIDQLSGAGSVVNGGGKLTVGAAGGSSNFSGGISGTGGLTKIGAGTFTLSGSNSFTGTVTLGNNATSGGNVNGALRITSAAALGGTTLVNVQDNNAAYATFQLDGSAAGITLPATLAINLNADYAGAGGTGANLLENIAGSNTIAGTITFNVGGVGYGIISDAGSLSFTAAQTQGKVLYLRGAGNGSFNAGWSGSGSINVSGPGTWELAAANSYTGSTTISGGTLRLSNSSALGSTSFVSLWNGAAIELQGGITISGQAVTLIGSGVSSGGALRNVSGNNTWNNPLNVDSTGATISVAAGSLSITGDLTGGSLTKAGAGTLSVKNVQTSALAVNAGVVAVAPARNASATSILSGLSVTAGAAFDLGSNDLLFHSTAANRAADMAAINALLASGFNVGNSGFWNGTGIISSAAANDASHLTTLGNLLNDDGAGNPIYGTGTTSGPIDGQNPSVNDIIVRYTYFGDADLSGHVDGTDYSKIDNGFNNALSGWFNGDFNYDGKIDGSDYSLIDNAFNTQGPSLGMGGAAAATTEVFSSTMITGARTVKANSSAVSPVAGVVGMDAEQKKVGGLKKRLSIYGELGLG